MRNGKYSSNKWRLPGKRQIAIIASIALLLVGMVGGTVAWLMTSTEDVENTFTPAAVPPEIEETKPEENGNVKEHVSVTNTGNIDAYIRAAVIINWVDETGKVIAEPEGHTYEIDFAEDTGWILSSDGYYYYTTPVAANGGKTGELITSAKPKTGTEYKLQIDIAAQTIQAVPTSVVTEKWNSGVNSVNGTTLEIKAAE